MQNNQLQSPFSASFGTSQCLYTIRFGTYKTLNIVFGIFRADLVLIIRLSEI